MGALTPISKGGTKEMKDKYELKAKEDGLHVALTEVGDENPIIRAKLDALGFLCGETDPITDTEVSVPQTDEDLDNLVAILKSEREGIAEYSTFGDPNWKVIDAQIEICEWAKGKS